jgi:DNA-binding transcriptional LysR family regulator
MTTVLQAFREHRPHVALDLREDDPIKHLLLVRERDLDCAFVRLPETLDDELIAYPLVAVPTMVILPKGHRFGTRRVVRLRELADEDWVFLGRAIDDSFTADIVALCRSVGFMPHVAQETNDVRVLLGLVAAGLGIAIGTTAARDTGVHGLHFASTSPSITMRYGVVARRNADAPPLAAFISHIRSTARVTGTPGEAGAAGLR